MNHSAALLRLLEPAVRPIPAQPASRPAQLPIEQRSFESLLAEVQTGPTAQPASPPTDSPAAAPADPLRALGGVGSIENASLRGWMERTK